MTLPKITFVELNGGPDDGRLIVGFFGARNRIRIVGEHFSEDYVDFRVKSPDALLGNEEVLTRSETELEGTFVARGIAWPWKSYAIQVQVYNDATWTDHDFPVQSWLAHFLFGRKALPPPVTGVLTCTPRISGVSPNWDDAIQANRGKILFNPNGSPRLNTIKIQGSCFNQNPDATVRYTGAANDTYTSVSVNVISTSEIQATFNASFTGTMPTTADVIVTVQNPRTSNWWRLEVPAQT